MGQAAADTYTVLHRLDSRGVTAATFEHANILRRAEKTLRGWAEAECGDSGPHASWSIERDEETGKPYRCVYPHDGPASRWPTPDREAGTLRRVAAVCAEIGAHYYHQTDPRGCALYVGAVPLTDQNYTSHGAACCA